MWQKQSSYAGFKLTAHCPLQQCCLLLGFFFFFRLVDMGQFDINILFSESFLKMFLHENPLVS